MMRWIVIAMIATFALLYIAASRAARAADAVSPGLVRVSGWVIQVCHARPVDRGCDDLLDDGEPWPSRTDCQVAIQRVRIEEKAARLSCQYVSDLRPRPAQAATR